MHPTGTHFNYYHICKRKLWLFANGINMEHNSDLVYEGKLIHENTYPQRSERYQEVEIDGIKIDFYDVKNKLVHEIKKTDKMELAHEWQLKYYLFVLERNGIHGATGILEYPTLRQTAQVILTDEDRKKIIEIEREIILLIAAESATPTIKSRICKQCSYYDFCYVSEMDTNTND